MAMAKPAHGKLTLQIRLCANFMCGNIPAKQAMVQKGITLRVTHLEYQNSMEKLGFILTALYTPSFTTER